MMVDESETEGGAGGHGCEGLVVDVGEDERFEEVEAD